MWTAPTVPSTSMEVSSQSCNYFVVTPDLNAGPLFATGTTTFQFAFLSQISPLFLETLDHLAACWLLLAAKCYSLPACLKQHCKFWLLKAFWGKKYKHLMDTIFILLNTTPPRAFYVTEKKVIATLKKVLNSISDVYTWILHVQLHFYLHQIGVHPYRKYSDLIGETIYCRVGYTLNEITS